MNLTFFFWLDLWRYKQIIILQNSKNLLPTFWMIFENSVFYTVQYFTVQYCTVQYCTVQYFNYYNKVRKLERNPYILKILGRHKLFLILFKLANTVSRDEFCERSQRNKKIGFKRKRPLFENDRINRRTGHFPDVHSFVDVLNSKKDKFLKTFGLSSEHAKIILHVDMLKYFMEQYYFIIIFWWNSSGNIMYCSVFYCTDFNVLYCTLITTSSKKITEIKIIFFLNWKNIFEINGFFKVKNTFLFWPFLVNLGKLWVYLERLVNDVLLDLDFNDNVGLLSCLCWRGSPFSSFSCSCLSLSCCSCLLCCSCLSCSSSLSCFSSSSFRPIWSNSEFTLEIVIDLKNTPNLIKWKGR